MKTNFEIESLSALRAPLPQRLTSGPCACQWRS
ncbi:MAG: hypothetical protein AzoDbin1_03581 [Azoarcus sp.]|uniref:Uncharacterized protein n=1 Tax=Aromatoleum tolulyticum TaxID=34027 RepID=A0A1N6W8M8_9RHOO|nr:hypothetical protein [Azoarcus sp.]SIQ86360.1 hypothetical protein SAMN05421829_107166 [Aromatoleum tolulyticum]